MEVVSLLTPTFLKQRARLGALGQQAKCDTRETTRAAREKFLANFIDLVDPDRTLSEPERLRRVEAAKRLYFTRLAIKSAKSRQRRSRAKKRTARLNLADSQGEE